MIITFDRCAPERSNNAKFIAPNKQACPPFPKKHMEKNKLKTMRRGGEEEMELIKFMLK